MSALLNGERFMRWIFVGQTVLEEMDSGYAIALISGSWADPCEVKPIFTGGFDFATQARMLREGLDYAKSPETYHMNDHQNDCKTSA